MMRWIIGSSLRGRLVVAVAAALLIVFGFTQLGKQPIDALPEFSKPYVEVQTEALGLSAAEMEALITTPLEADLLNGVSWVETIRSKSIPGMSSIVMTFEKGTDIMRARQMVQERLIGIHALPNVSTPPAMMNPLSSASRCMEIGLTSDQLSLIDMSVLARWTVKPRLMGVHGVANVSIFGQRKRQLQVQIDPERLRDENVSLMQVIRTTGNALWVSPLSFLEASTPGTGGWIDTPNQRLGIRHLLPITTADDLAKVSIENAYTKSLGDVANVVEDHQLLIGDAVVNDAPALMLVVEKFPWANTKDVTQGVEKALASLRLGLPDLEMDTSLFRPATFLEQMASNLSTIMLIGGIFLAIAFFAFMFNWRTALISVFAVITSVCAAGAVLYLRGTEFNMMIIAGIALAIAAFVDDAIVDTDHIVRRIRKARDDGSNKSTATIIFESVLEIRSPIFYATIIMLLAVMPIMFLEGVSAALFQPFATSYMLALLASMVVALSVTPALSLLLLRTDPLTSSGSPVTNALSSLSSALFGWATSVPRPAFIAVCVLTVIGIASYPFLREESVLPDLKETDLVVRFEGSSGASHPAMSRVTTLASRELRSLPGVHNVSAHIGRAIMSDKHTNVNNSDLWVNIDPTADYDATVAAVKEVVAGYPGLSPEVLTYRQSEIRNELSGTSESMVVRVYGDDFDTISGKAEEIQAMMAKIDGIVDPKVQYAKVEPNLEIEVDLEKAKKFGLKPGDVRRSATSLVSGLMVGSLFEEQKVFDVVVIGTPDIRHSKTSLEELLIDTPRGGHVRLKEVADVRIRPNAVVINRDAVARSIDVVATARGRDLATIAGEVESGITQIGFPLEYRAELLGEFAERLAARNRVTAFAIAAAIGIFLLLQVAFGSWRLATVMFVTLPMALSGGAITAFLTTGGLLTFGSVVGFAAILGIAVRNGIVLVNHIRQLEKEEGGVFSAEIVKRAVSERSGTILMSAVTTALAFLPIVFMGSVAGLEVLQPMAAIVLGGLVTSTLFSLMGVPAMYLLFGEYREPDLELHPITVVEEQLAASKAEPAMAGGE